MLQTPDQAYVDRVIAAGGTAYSYAEIAEAVAAYNQADAAYTAILERAHALLEPYDAWQGRPVPEHLRKLEALVSGEHDVIVEFGLQKCSHEIFPVKRLIIDTKKLARLSAKIAKELQAR